ncbi:MAG TPA: phytoene/squalene synthase family protein [Verrucomicrobiae bacterium]|nr:phytoene/squalene synthase family protein [Verrucomicrobiae bacterium]
MAGSESGGELLTSLLRDVSRSFYLTLRVLPAAVRPQIGLAYLLARATDTIADTEIVPVAGRLRALGQLRARILGSSSAPLDFRPFLDPATPQSASAAEQLLLARIEEALTVLGTLDAADQKLVRAVLDTITSGQELDLRRFELERASAGSEIMPAALASHAELDDYTYRVAGCVGEFWTRICRAHLFPQAALDEAGLIRDGIQFGQGLQLVNILRDLPADLRKGRCYLPADQLAGTGLTPRDLLDPANMRRLQGLYDQYLALAEARLEAGWRYTNQLPRGQTRARLACAWPILIGVKTLAKLRTSNVLDAAQRVKISRADVRSVMIRSVLFYPLTGSWRGLFAWAKR